MKIVLIFVLIVGMSQITGCAFGSRYVELSYPPERTIEIDLPESPPQVSGPRTRNIVLNVNDVRETRDRIGNVRNGFGMDTASILTEVNIEVWVNDAIVSELEKLGYEVLNQRDAMSADKLTAEIQKVYCDIYAVYDGEVTLQATLTQIGEEPLQASYPTKVSSGLSWAASGRATGESLAQALQTAIHNMFYDLGFSVLTAN